jgi:carbon starvation protein
MKFGLALSFALLAFSTFVYDTLDVCTRLARYVLQELFGWQTNHGRYIATFITLVLPLAFLAVTKEKGYLIAWPVFGTTNQLLASLILLAISVWLIKSGRNALYTILPMIFMLVITLWALVLQVLDFWNALPAFVTGVKMKPDVMISGVCGFILLMLSILLVSEAVRVLLMKNGKKN